MRKLSFAFLGFFTGSAPVLTAHAAGPVSASPSQPSVMLCPADPRARTAETLARTTQGAVETQLRRSALVVAPTRGNAREASCDACKSDPACLARLGRRAHTTGVVTVSVEPLTGKYGRVEVVLIATNTNRVAGRALLEPAGAAELEKALGAEIPNLLAALSQTAPPSDELDLVPLAEIPAAPASTAPSTAPAASAPTVAPSSVQVLAPPPAAKRHYMAWTGAGVGAVSVGLLAGAIHYGLKAYDLRDRLQEHNNNIPVVNSFDAVEMIKDYNERIDRANTLYALAGVTGAVGIALVALDLAWLSRTRPTLAISPQAIQAELAFSW